MSGLRRPLHTSTEDEESLSSITLSSSRRTAQSPQSPGVSFSRSSLFRRSGYHRMASDGTQELSDLQGRDTPSQQSEPPQLPHIMRNESMELDDLGILSDIQPKRKSNLRRVPVGSKTMSVGSPRSDHDLLASPSSSSVASPALIYGGCSQHDHGATSDHSFFMPQPKTSTRNVPDTNTFVGNASPLFAQESPEATYTYDITNDDDDKFHNSYSGPPDYCSSKQEIHTKKSDWLSLTIYALSIYSTTLSGLWLVVAFVQPRWGHQISTSAGLDPSTATTVAALVAKTIEMSFVTVFVSFLGQVLTRRSFVKTSSGMTLAEMTMRNWVIQPGSLITHAENIPTGALSVLGMLTLTATLASAFYTTASDAMVSPKLKYGAWESKQLSGYIRTSYANISYQNLICPNLFDEDEDGPNACMESQFSGQSYQNLLGFLKRWDSIHDGDAEDVSELSKRPAGTHLLYENTTMYGSWIERDTSNVTQLSEIHKRIVNNVTMAMPHPGLYQAATHPINGILQPKDLGDVGGYSVKAGVVSPAINAMCVEMTKEDLEPLVYTEWPDANSSTTGVGDQVTGHDGWEGEVPGPYNQDGEAIYLNETKVDDIFRWGERYQRRPPVFQLYPYNFNMVVNSSVDVSDAIYILARGNLSSNYTMCELRSWVSPMCSTNFDISGTSGAHMKAHCEDKKDDNAYWRSFEGDQEWPGPSRDWMEVAKTWRFSMHLNGGTQNDNASNSRILTQLILTEPALPAKLPSLAEALAVYAASSIVNSAIDTPFKHWWDYLGALDEPGDLQPFNASLRTQEYTSGHTNDWQTLFYVVLVLVFGINVTCAVYFLFLSRLGMVTDFTEPQNMFALAVNSPPSVQLKGGCGGGPRRRDIVVPWRVAWAESANHYFFTEANDGPWKGKYAIKAGDYDKEPANKKGAGYKRLSSGKGWL